MLVYIREAKGMELLTVKEVAEILRITDRAMRERLRRGEIKGVKIGHNWRIEKQALDDYIKRQ